MDKMREDFEKWFKKDFHPDKSGPYLKNMLLESWKASRESLVVELPISTYETPSGDNALREDSVFDAIESAGIKVVQR